MKAHEEYALAQKQPIISLDNGAKVTHKQPIIKCVNDMTQTARGEKIGIDGQEIVFEQAQKKKNSVSDELCDMSLSVWQLHLTRLFCSILVAAWFQQFMSNVCIAGAKMENFLGCISGRINMNKSIRKSTITSQFTYINQIIKITFLTIKLQS